MEVVTKKELVEQLQGMLDEVVKECRDDMSFHVNIELSGIDSDFMEISKRYNIKKADSKKQLQADIRAKGQI